MNDFIEVWKAIEVAPGYEVSDRGSVRSWRVWGSVKGHRGCFVGIGDRSRVLALKVDRDGYHVAFLMIDKKLRCFGVHHLMALAFLGHPLVGKTEVRHLDGNPLNNILGNLMWGTREENAADMVLHGRSMRGVKNNKAKLTEEKVLRVFALRRSGWTQEEIAMDVGVSQVSVHNILTGKTWTHVAVKLEE